MGRNYHLYFKKNFILRMPRVANFAGIIAITIQVIKTTLKDSKNVKGIRSYELKCNLCLCFLI